MRKHRKKEDDSASDLVLDGKPMKPELMAEKHFCSESGMIATLLLWTIEVSFFFSLLELT